MTAPVPRTGATDREVEARQAAIKALHEATHVRMGDGHTSIVVRSTEQTVDIVLDAARAAVAPDSGQRDRLAVWLLKHFPDTYENWIASERADADAILALLAEQPGDHSARESVSHSSFPKSYTREERARAARNGPGESGVICSDCGWLVGGPNAHPDAEAQHRQHLAEQPGGGR